MLTVPFTFTQFNIGNHGTSADLWRACNPAHSDVTSLNEMYNRRCQKILYQMLDDHPELDAVIFPDVEGARADVLVYHRMTLTLRDPRHYKVLDSGTRAGKHNMQKNLIGGRFQFAAAPCRMNLFVKHDIQTQGPEERKKAAVQMSNNVVGLTDHLEAITMIGSDRNAIPGAASMRPYVTAGFHDTQVLDPKDTFKHRNIDGVHFQAPASAPKALQFVGNTLVDGGHSDHWIIRAGFRVQVKPW